MRSEWGIGSKKTETLHKEKIIDIFKFKETYWRGVAAKHITITRQTPR
jgi:hypothetical protein